MISNIEESLSSIINVDGINGTMAIDKNKDILGALMPDLYDHDSLVDVADQIGMTYGTLKELKIRPEEITFEYEGMHLFMKDLRGKGILVVLHDSDVSNAFLNIATNIARKRARFLVRPKRQ